MKVWIDFGKKKRKKKKKTRWPPWTNCQFHEFVGFRTISPKLIDILSPNFLKIIFRKVGIDFGQSRKNKMAAMDKLLISRVRWFLHDISKTYQYIFSKLCGFIYFGHTKVRIVFEPIKKWPPEAILFDKNRFPHDISKTY